jgi:hypothetical protein
VILLRMTSTIFTPCSIPFGRGVRSRLCAGQRRRRSDRRTSSDSLRWPTRTTRHRMSQLSQAPPIVVLAVALRDQRASGLPVVLLTLLGVALMPAASRVDVPMLNGGNPETWNGWARHRFSRDHRDGRSRAADDGSRGARRIYATTDCRFRSRLARSSSYSSSWREATPHSSWRSSLSSPVLRGCYTPGDASLVNHRRSWVAGQLLAQTSRIGPAVR